MCGGECRSSSGQGDKLRNRIQTSIGGRPIPAALPSVVPPDRRTGHTSPAIVHSLTRVCLCDPVDCSFPVPHPEFAQTHVCFLTVSLLNVIVWFLTRETGICSSTGGKKGETGHTGLIYTQTPPTVFSSFLHLKCFQE